MTMKAPHGILALRESLDATSVGRTLIESQQRPEKTKYTQVRVCRGNRHAEKVQPSAGFRCSKATLIATPGQSEFGAAHIGTVTPRLQRVQTPSESGFLEAPSQKVFGSKILSAGPLTKNRHDGMVWQSCGRMSGTLPQPARVIFLLVCVNAVCCVKSCKKRFLLGEIALNNANCLSDNGARWFNQAENPISCPARARRLANTFR